MKPPAVGNALIRLILFFVFPALLAVAEPPQLDSLRLHALRPGTTNSVIIEGKRLDEIHTVWTSWHGQGPVPLRDGSSRSPERAELSIVLPRTLPAGIEMIRVIGSNGVSNPLLVLVDPLPAVANEGTNKSPASARPADVPGAIDGTCAELGSQFFKLKVRRARPLSIEVVANRLGYPTDPVLRLLNSAGKELLYVNDTRGMGSDCAVEFTPPASEELLIELRDSEFSGGEKQRYRLRIGDFPVALCTFPPGADSSGESRVRWLSTVSERSGEATLAPLIPGASPVARIRPVGKKFEASITPRLPMDPSPALVESEPNDMLENPDLFGTSRLASGRFDRPGDRDWFQFSVEKPASWRVEIRSRRLGLSCDPVVRLLDEDGKVLATGSNDRLDASLGFEFKQAGKYHVAVEEAAGRAGTGLAYQLRLLEGACRFEVSTETDVLSLSSPTNSSLKLKIARNGDDRPIRLEATGLPDGTEIENPAIEAKKTEWELKFKRSDATRPGSWGRIQIVARPEPDDGSVPARLQLNPAMKKHFAELLALPPGLAEDLWYYTDSRDSSDPAPAKPSP